LFIRRLHRSAAGASAEQSLGSRPPLPCCTHELYESRPYFPGDDPRKIHWKLYAHTQTLSIKLGAFEPPPVKRLTIYIEEPVVLKKERVSAAAVYDAFIGRLSGVIVQLLNAGIQCSLLLYDYPQKALQHYELIEEGSAAAAQIQNLLAVPALRFSPEAIPDAAVVFNAVHGGGLLYCYLPAVGKKIAASPKSTAGEKAPIYEAAAYKKITADEKIAACRRSGIEIYAGRFPDDRRHGLRPGIFFGCRA